MQVSPGIGGRSYRCCARHVALYCCIPISLAGAGNTQKWLWIMEKITQNGTGMLWSKNLINKKRQTIRPVLPNWLLVLQPHVNSCPSSWKVERANYHDASWLFWKTTDTQEFFFVTTLSNHIPCILTVTRALWDLPHATWIGFKLGALKLSSPSSIFVNSHTSLWTALVPTCPNLFVRISPF